MPNCRDILWILTSGLFLVDCAQSPLRFLKRFSPLSYDAEPIHEAVAAHRSRRSVSDSLEIQFRSQGKQFHLVLYPDGPSTPSGASKEVGSVFSPTLDLDVDGQAQDIQDFAHLIYVGHLKDKPESYAYGSVFDGIFDGYIETYPGSPHRYYVERVSKYFGHNHNSTYHSIIYSDKDVDEDSILRRGSGSPHRDPRSVEFLPGCALHGHIQKDLEHVQHLPSTPVVTPKHTKKGHFDTPNLFYVPNEDVRWYKYSQATAYGAGHGNRTRRQLIPANNADAPQQLYRKDVRGYWNVRSCSLYVQTDQMLFRHIKAHEGQGDDKRTKEEIYALVNNHIRAVKKIYEETSFHDIKGITFVVQRITIYTPDTCMPSDDEPVQPIQDGGNPFCKRNVDVSYYLNLNSKKDHSSFCLAYALTYRDFVGGTLGLAWVASSVSGTSGGICEQFKTYNEGKGRVQRSLNTGIITLVNYNNRVPPKVSQLTMAHEIGHNFGAPHDFPEDCIPGLPDGNFIMFASATSGDKPNNAKFSICSVNNISAVLDTILRIPPEASNIPSTVGATKRNCFQLSDTAFCGNQFVENDEQCDCGFDLRECQEREGVSESQETCCLPRTQNGDRTGCFLRPGKNCSPTQGQCCSSSCSLLSGNVCKAAEECHESSVCNGREPQCPPPVPRNEMQACGNNTMVCKQGKCEGSICEAIGMVECYLTEGDANVKCQLACRGSDGVCSSSFKIEQLQPFWQRPLKGIMLRPGHPCDDFKGYCDVFQKCRSVDSNGPLSRLKNLLFNPETFKTIEDWIQLHWWAVVLMGVGLVLLMALFIKCCAVHTPSSNPNRPPAQSIYDTLRRPATLLRSQHGRSRGGESRSRGHSAAPGGGARSHHHHHHRRRSAEGGGRRGRSAGGRGAPTSSGAASGAAVTPLAGAPVPSLNGLNPLVEPPPPYSAAIASDPPPALPPGPPPSAPPPPQQPPGGGPPRGHRKHRHKKEQGRKDLEMKTRGK